MASFSFQTHSTPGALASSASGQTDLSSSDGIMYALTTLREENPDFNKVISMRQVSRGEVVANAEELTQRMFVLVEGKINLVCTNSEGRRLVVGMLQPGAIFGEGALSTHSDPNVVAEAASDISLWTIPSSEARNATMQYPILGWGLLQTYGERLFQVENSLEDVAYKKLPERLAALLLNLCDSTAGTIRGTSHQALADHLGTYRETVSAILRDFKRQGLVELGYRRINVLNVEDLREIAGIWDW